MPQQENYVIGKVPNYIMPELENGKPDNLGKP